MSEPTSQKINSRCISEGQSYNNDTALHIMHTLYIVDRGHDIIAAMSWHDSPPTGNFDYWMHKIMKCRIGVTSFVLCSLIWKSCWWKAGIEHGTRIFFCADKIFLCWYNILSTFQEILLPGPRKERVGPRDHLYHRPERALPHRHAQDQAQSFSILHIDVQ